MNEMYTVQMLFTPSSGDTIRNLGYGLGWFVGEYRGCEYIHHGGVVDGFTAQVAFLPQKKAGLVILTNSSSDGFTAITHIEQAVFDKILGFNVKHSLPEKRFSSSGGKILTIAPSRPLQDYVGEYAHPAYGLINITISNGQIILFYAQKSIPLTALGDSLFTANLFELQRFGVLPQIEISFSMNSAGKISEIHVPFEAFRSGKPVVFTRR